MVATVERNYSLRVRLSQGEKRDLEAIALAEGLSVSDWIRQQIRRSKAQPDLRATGEGAAR